MSDQAIDEEAIFKIACRIKAQDARAEYLKQACGSDDALTEKAGSIIGPYKLLQPIGEGGFGVVFMAEQQQPVRRKVALKIIKPGMDTRQVIARFEAERQALALMDHPNVARIFDGGATESGRPYFVMELVKGLPITEFCDQNHLNPRERLQLFIHLCQAVQHAHQKGIIHRDIKPSNVLITLHDGTPVVKIIDFGIAKATGQQLTEKTLFTNFAQMIGTPLYMSPEQAEMSGLDIDTRSDIYSLGVLLYELLTGLTPFDKDRLRQAAFDEIRRIIREEEPPRPSTRMSTSDTLPAIAAQRRTDPKLLASLVRGDLDWIVMKALEKDRTRRYETANDLVRDIQRHLADEPIEACPPSARYRFGKFVRRNKRILTTASLVALALVVGIAISTWQALRARDAESLAKERLIIAETNSRIAEEQRVVAKNQEALAREQELLARRRLYSSQIHLASQAWELGHTARLLELLQDQRPAPGQKDLRTFEWFYLWRLCHTGRRFSFPGHKHWVNAVALSPDGKTLASGSWDTTVKLWDTTNGQERITLKGHTSAVHSVAFSPDGKTFASGSWNTAAGGEVKLWNLDTNMEIATLKGQTGIRSVAFSPDGKTLASASDDQSVKLWDVATGKEHHALKGHSGVVMSVAFSRDGKAIATGSGDETAKVWTWDGAAWINQKTLRGQGWVYCVAFSPDGRTLAAAAADLKLWDVGTGKERAGNKRSPGKVNSLAFTPDGMTLVLGMLDRTVKLWDPESGEERPHLALAHLAPVLSVAISHDGKMVASGGKDRTVKLWDIAKSTDVSQFQAGHGITSLAFSADAETVFVGDSTVSQFDHKTGLKRSTLKFDGSHSFCGPLSPDRKNLATADNVGAVKIWDIKSGRETAHFHGHKEGVHAIAFSSDGETLATASQDSTVILWDVAKSKSRLALKGNGWPISSVAFAPDGRTVATGNQDGLVQLYDSSTGKEGPAVHLFQEWIWALCFSRDGKTLAAGSERGTVRIWDVAPLKARAFLKGHANVIRSIDIFPDGNTVVTGSDNGTVKLWDAITGQERMTLREHTTPIVSVAIAPDGKTLAAGSRSGDVRIWRAANGIQKTKAP